MFPTMTEDYSLYNGNAGNAMKINVFELYPIGSILEDSLPFQFTFQYVTIA